MLNSSEKRRLLEARDKAKAEGTVTTVHEFERLSYRISPNSNAARLARWDDLEQMIYRLSSHVERHGLQPGDEARFDRFVEYLKEAKRIARSASKKKGVRVVAHD